MKLILAIRYENRYTHTLGLGHTLLPNTPTTLPTRVVSTSQGRRSRRRSVASGPAVAEEGNDRADALSRVSFGLATMALAGPAGAEAGAAEQLLRAWSLLHERLEEGAAY